MLFFFSFINWKSASNDASTTDRLPYHKIKWKKKTQTQSHIHFSLVGRSVALPYIKINSFFRSECDNSPTLTESRTTTEHCTQQQQQKLTGEREWKKRQQKTCFLCFCDRFINVYTRLVQWIELLSALMKYQQNKFMTWSKASLILSFPSLNSLFCIMYGILVWFS